MHNHRFPFYIQGSIIGAARLPLLRSTNAGLIFEQYFEEELDFMFENFIFDCRKTDFF